MKNLKCTFCREFNSDYQLFYHATPC